MHAARKLIAVAAWVKKPHHWRSSLYSRIIRRRQRWIWRQSWGFWLGSGSARTKQRNLWSKDCKNGFRMLRSRTSTLCTNVLLYYSLPESQCDGNFSFLLKFRKFQYKFSFWNFQAFTPHKITNQLTLINGGFLEKFFFGRNEVCLFCIFFQMKITVFYMKTEMFS